MYSTKNKQLRTQSIMDQWSGPTCGELSSTTSNWRSLVDEKMKEGDIQGMRRAALPSVQRQIIELAHESSSDQIRLQASQVIMGQEGQGAVQRIEHGMQYDKMPADQLKAIILSKVAKLQTIIPDFSLESLIEQARKECKRNAIEIESYQEESETEL